MVTYRRHGLLTACYDSYTRTISFKCAVISNVVFWTLSLLGLYIDTLAASQRQSIWKEFKIQPHSHLSRQERNDLIGLAAFNMILVAPFLCCPIFDWLWDSICHFQGVPRLSERDEWFWQQEILLKLPLHAFIAEAGFYLIHILLHSSSILYRHVHKVHHRFVAPTAMTCVYAHPLEFAVGNIFPVYLGPMLTNSHPTTCYLIWFPVAMAGTCKGHCGYRWFGMEDPHDAHHVLVRCNFGAMGPLDWIFGTSCVTEKCLYWNQEED